MNVLSTKLICTRIFLTRCGFSKLFEILVVPPIGVSAVAPHAEIRVRLLAAAVVVVAAPVIVVTSASSTSLEQKKEHGSLLTNCCLFKICPQNEK